MPSDSSRAGRFYEFFAGGGLARLGLAPSWRCVFANDIDPRKVAQYEAAFGAGEMRGGDVWGLDGAHLPRGADLAWASFPCQDLSLAGARGGLSAPRSGAFWGFWRLIEQLGEDAPPIIALENVVGLITSRGGADFTELVATLARGSYCVGALTIDASRFVPQSRPRVFVIATRGGVPENLRRSQPDASDGALTEIVSALAPKVRASWVWWRLPEPPLRNTALADLLEPDDAVVWRSRTETAALLALMAPRHRALTEELKLSGQRHVGAAFRRMRVESGNKVQRVEARFDGLAGCLRTPAGGSSRQTVLVIDKKEIRSRLLTPRECARLMGVPEDYPLPHSANAALHLMGDAVAAPVVRWLGEHLLTPLARAARKTARAA